jgi:hypothetical protein
MGIEFLNCLVQSIIKIAKKNALYDLQSVINNVLVKRKKHLVIQSFNHLA